MNGKTSLKLQKLSYIITLLLLPSAVLATDITSINGGKSANGSYEIQINGSDFSDITSYSLSNPSRIVVDIPNARSQLTDNIKKFTNPVIDNIAVIEGDDRVRATINLSENLPYTLIDSPNRITVAIKDQSQKNLLKNKKHAKTINDNRLAKIDFKRGSEGQGQVEIKLPNDNTIIDVTREGTRVVAKLRGGQFGKSRKLNVSDFGTPVKSIDILKNHLNIATAHDDFEIVSYQSDNIFSIEFNKPIKQQEDQALLLPGDSKKKYTGETLSLNFQDIDVRAVLQLIGDFTDTNIVVSDEVGGSITLRLNNVPWDQALDIILQTKGLSKQENGNVVYIAPSEVIAANKKAAYSVANVEKELAPLQQQLIQIKYARAENLKQIIDESKKNSSNDNLENRAGLLSPRGSITVDTRTNTLIVSDVPSSIDRIRQLVNDLDIPVNQVLIDARIVAASNNFAHELGVRWGGAFVGATDDVVLGGAGNVRGANTITSSANQNISTTGQAFPATTPALSDRLGVNLATTSGPTGSLGLSLLGADFLLDLELSALQNDGRGEIISSPRVITQDGTKARIEQGTEIAYTTRDEGTATVAFKDVDLSMDVTPKIAPNHMIDMILDVKKDTVGALTQTLDGVIPSINTSGVQTQVLVDNGETIVLGGVYEQSKTKSVSKVPVLGDLPVVGRAFRRDVNSVKKSELLIFVTPKIIDKRYVSRDKFSEIRK